MIVRRSWSPLILWYVAIRFYRVLNFHVDIYVKPSSIQYLFKYSETINYQGHGNTVLTVLLRLTQYNFGCQNKTWTLDVLNFWLSIHLGITDHQTIHLETIQVSLRNTPKIICFLLFIVAPTAIWFFSVTPHSCWSFPNELCAI